LLTEIGTNMKKYVVNICIFTVIL